MQNTKNKNFPSLIPVAPWLTYKNKFKSLSDFLGNEPRFNFLSYEEVKKYAQSSKIKSMREWFVHTKSKNFPKNIPSSPPQTYNKKGWKNWGDFLGTNRVANQLKNK